MPNLPQPELTALWDQRALQYGRRAVMDLAIPESEFADATQAQRAILRPHLFSVLNGSEKRVLDYGCGSGRFTSWLAGLPSNPTVLGYDPSIKLIELAPTPSNGRVSYNASPPEAFFHCRQVDGDKFDLIWVTLVLGGLPPTALPSTAKNLLSLLAPGGLLFLAEHTSEQPSGNDFWPFYKISFFQDLFKPAVNLARLGGYPTRGTEVSVFAGRSSP